MQPGSLYYHFESKQELLLEIDKELIALRDGYERCFIDLIDELPLGKRTDKKLLRLMLIGAINSTQLWYRPGGLSPTVIGREFVNFLRRSLD